MNELSLFTGAGGGLLGTKLLGWNHIGYVEKDEYCQKVLAQRIKDGFLDEAPIFGDIRAFIDQGYARRYQNVADVVTAGFPCQPFSCAGKRKGADDERNMWPTTIECIRKIRPRFAFLENVPGLVSSGYFTTILGDLAESGYNCRWRILSAAEVGADHMRRRLWLLATDNNSNGMEGREKYTLPNSRRGWFWLAAGGGRAQARRWDLHPPELCRSRHDVADYVDRLKAIGNGQVPRVAATAWRLLTKG